jgi:hypothetical protein
MDAMAIEHRTFAATALREGRWWTITVPELDAVTQARNVREIEEMATGLVAALLDLEETDVTVNVTIELPKAVADQWNTAAALISQAEADEKRAAVLRRSAIRELLSMNNMSQTDVAAILGLSYQRVQQLAKAE